MQFDMYAGCVQDCIVSKYLQDLQEISFRLLLSSITTLFNESKYKVDPLLLCTFINSLSNCIPFLIELYNTVCYTNSIDHWLYNFKLVENDFGGIRPFLI